MSLSNISFQKIISFFIVLTNIKISVTQINDEKCNEISNIIYKPTSEIINYIKNNTPILKKSPQSCIDVLIKNGKLEELDFFVTELGKNNVEFHEILAVSINTMKKQLDEIYNKHRFDDKEYQIVSPAFRWAQSLNDVFIEIKYAHRHDSPGCLEIRDLKLDIQNNSVRFKGYCVLGDVPIKIDFGIDTYGEINITECTHGSGSVGRYQITLRKKEPNFWKKLLAEGSPVPPNMRVWFEMKEKYADELKKFEEKDDDDDFNKMYEKAQEEYNEEKKKKEEIKKKKEETKKKKTKKNKKKKGNGNNNTDSSNGAKNKGNKTTDL